MKIKTLMGAILVLLSILSSSPAVAQSVMYGLTRDGTLIEINYKDPGAPFPGGHYAQVRKSLPFADFDDVAYINGWFYGLFGAGKLCKFGFLGWG